MQLNEGLEKLGAKETVNGREYEGSVFEWSGVQHIRIPSTLKRLEPETFWLCKNLKSVEIPNGVEYIGKDCFKSSGVEKITLPGTLKEINKYAFGSCKNLKTIRVERGCSIDIK